MLLNPGLIASARRPEMLTSKGLMHHHNARNGTGSRSTHNQSAQAARLQVDNVESCRLQNVPAPEQTSSPKGFDQRIMHWPEPLSGASFASASTSPQQQSWIFVINTAANGCYFNAAISSGRWRA
jgi:hypothetical protein